MEKIILVQKNIHGRVKFIILTLEDAVVSREWGLIDGKTQTTSNTYDFINKNKTNELSPSEAALDDFNRLTIKKKKEGYIEVEYLDKLPDLEASNMNLDNLPVQFCCSKPHTKITKKTLDKLIAKNLVRFFIKENGLCHFVLITSKNEVKIYSRRIDDHTRKYPKLVKAFDNLKLPAGTLIAIELVVDDSIYKMHMERFQRVSSISKSDVLNGQVQESIEKTLALQEETPVVAMIFNILYLKGIDNTTTSYDLNIELAQDIESYDTSGFIKTPREISFSSYDEAYVWVKNNKLTIEGLVVWNKEENAEITYNGKPNRRACYKLKAVAEDDVVAYDWLEGSGSKQGKIGSLLIGKYNSEGELIPLGKVGSGLKPKQGDCEVENWIFPCVIEIEYEQRFPTGKYQFPRFSKKHEDKIPSDILLDERGF